MKRLIAIVFTFALCLSARAQLAVPKQVDTLVIQSMTYHFEEIDQANWPYQFILRKPDAFVFGEEEFSIIDSEKVIFSKVFSLKRDGEINELNLREEGDLIIIEFSNYVFKCRKNSKKAVDIHVPKVSDEKMQKNAPVTNDKPKKITREPTAQLEGRQILGSIPSPAYTAQASGVVVVDIWVDNYGNVQKAIVGDGTSVTDKTLWSAARNSAMKTHFSMKADAPALQQGTITYVFSLK